MIWLLLVLAAPLPDVDLAQYLSAPTPPTSCAGLSDFPTRSVDDGLLLSECEFARVIDLRSEHRRVARELAAVVRLRDKERQLWEMMADEYELQLATEQTWWRRHQWAAGVVGGVVMTSLIVWAAK